MGKNGNFSSHFDRPPVPRLLVFRSGDVPVGLVTQEECRRAGYGAKADDYASRKRCDGSLGRGKFQHPHRCPARCANAGANARHRGRFHFFPGSFLHHFYCMTPPGAEDERGRAAQPGPRIGCLPQAVDGLRRELHCAVETEVSRKL